MEVTQEVARDGGQNRTAMISHLCFHRDGTVALGTAVGAELSVAANTNRSSLVTDKPLPPEVLTAVEAV